MPATSIRYPEPEDQKIGDVDRLLTRHCAQTAFDQTVMVANEIITFWRK